MSTLGPRLLVVAKAPVAGQAKTRLARHVGSQVAAELAAASLLDTLRACVEAAGEGSCHAALTGDLDDAVRGDEIRRALAGWTVREQRGDDFATRLTNAHLDLPGDRPVVQVGMDTPQVRPEMLTAAGALTTDHEAVLGPAPDGGWWVLALRDPASARPLATVEMSTATTYDDTRRALEADGLRVGTTAELRDVDTVDDAEIVAADAPGTEFARVWGAR
ncbi:MAG: DUF2064 domain-containing protein [Nocardioides sp.]